MRFGHKIFSFFGFSHKNCPDFFLTHHQGDGSAQPQDSAAIGVVADKVPAAHPALAKFVHELESRGCLLLKKKI